MSESSTANRKAKRRRSRLLLVVAAVGVLGLAGGGVAIAATTAPAGDYRTATARQGDVTQVVDAVGTVAAADRYDLSFDVAGEVASVSVNVGDVVDSGAVLATLDTASLQDAVDDAQSTLDDAEDQLASDETAQSSTTESSTTESSTTEPSGSETGSSGTGTPGSDASGGGASGGETSSPVDPTTPDDDGVGDDPAVVAAVAAVTAAQDALTAQYDAATAALTVSSDAVTSSGAACQPFLDAAIAEEEQTESDDTTSTDDTTEEVPSADDSASDDGSGAIVEALEACQAAIGTVLENQSTVDDAQSTLMQRATELNDAVTALQDAIADATASASTDADLSAALSATGDTSIMQTSTAATTTTPSSSAVTVVTAADVETPDSTSSTGSESTSGATTTITAETLLADAAAITLAEQQLAVAEQQLAANTITAPASGTIAAVAVAAGDDVDAASTTAVITLIADTGYVVDTTLPLSDVRVAAVGQDVVIGVEGSSEDLVGTVSSIGVLDVSETSTPSFAVTVSIADTDATPLIGTAASLAITAAAATDVLVVPTSAVHVSGTETTIDVLVDGVLESRSVDVGATGTDYSEIADGLEAGDLVVLADLDEEIASSDTETETGLGGLGGAGDTQERPSGDFPGGGTPPGGGQQGG